jgi:hypothetical protein
MRKFIKSVLNQAKTFLATITVITIKRYRRKK